ncbi:MAG: TonB-dependent receptor plug domain-containing protein [Bacteroidetes bacterium]|nr:TonB-dependent receptor plug domain-containing protein [Bacteroidota bacterium]
MLRKLLFVIFATLLANGLIAQSSGIKGKVADKETGEGIPFANVAVEQDGQNISGGITDFNGNFLIKPIPPGRYTLKASYVGYNTFQLNDVLCKAGSNTVLDVKLESTSQLIPDVIVTGYKVPLIDKDKVSSTETVTAKEIAQMPGRDASSVATTVGGVYSEDGEIGSIRGSRSEGNATFVDGIRIIGSSSIPAAAIEQVQVTTGGIPARYGDVTGGIINMTTKGPSGFFFGGIEGVTSEVLDPYGYNLLGFSISGPILKVVDKEYPDRKKSVLGFFISGELSHIADGGPSAIGMWKVKDEINQDIINDPLRPSGLGFGTFQNADFLGEENFEKIDAKLNVGSKRINLQGKIEFKPSKNLNFILGGSYLHNDRTNYSYAGSLFNWENNSQSVYDNWRTYIRITQKFGSQTTEEEANALVKNVYYTLQFDYEKTDNLNQDVTHKDNLFGYGYIGKFEHHVENNYSFGLDTTLNLSGYVHDNYIYILDTFIPGGVNVEAEKWTSRYFEMDDILANARGFRVDDDVSFGLGILNGEGIPSVYGLWTSPGSVSNSYSISDNGQFRVSAFGSADIGDHAIEMGFEFEQRSFRSYAVGPVGLWSLARDMANMHIDQLDFTKPHALYLRDDDGNLIYNDMGEAVFMDTIWYSRLYSAENQALFDLRFRESQNMELDGLNWIDVDSYDPSELSIDYFSADELLNSGNSYVGYVGYDAWGNRLTQNPSLQDFFSDTYTDINGNKRYKREKAPFEPIYSAAFIQDHFQFDDLVFNVGVRIDRFDANQMTLKDKYLLYDSYTAGDSDPKGILSNHPDNIGDDYTVYVDNVMDPTSIKGYRNGSTWYDANGTEVADPDIISSATGIAPYLVHPEIDMNSEDYLVSMSFEDYKPAITVMPRISFSFPISDEALFFAHYDVLSKRPSFSNNFDPMDYLFFITRAGDMVNNPNLRPEKTIDYELGFQQRLSSSSALRLTAFYKEMRDMQQAVMVVGAFPLDYMTYGNIDFGTVKGFTATYDMRRTGNVSLRTSYTLQFANGTGSNVNDAVSILRSEQPNLRTTIPLNFDQRHALVATVDFRFAGGQNYNGPKSLKKILSNAGVNTVLRFGTGSPYTKRSIIGNTIEGSMNGSREPSRTSINMKIDKNINLSLGEGEDKKKIYLNVYFDISNVLNTLNIRNVYATTGNPDDNGYLFAPQNQPAIETQTDEEAYRNYYAMMINNPGNYTLPRRIRFGVILGF